MTEVDISNFQLKSGDRSANTQDQLSRASRAQYMADTWDRNTSCMNRANAMRLQAGLWKLTVSGLPRHAKLTVKSSCNIERCLRTLEARHACWVCKSRNNPHTGR